MDQDLIGTAVEALSRAWTGSDLSVEYEGTMPEHPTSGWRPDAVLTVSTGSGDASFALNAKRELNTAHAVRLADRVQADDRTWIVVSPKISAPVAAVFRERGVNYLDAAGNAHVEHDGLLIHVEGRTWRPPERPVRAFSGEGLKVIFVLLIDPSLVSESYRSLAELAGVSHGVVQYTMADLVRLGFVVRTGRSERYLPDAADMLDRWARGYTDALRPKLSEGVFTFPGADDGERVRDWLSLALDPDDDLWGGEPAAAIKTNHLRPGHLTVYTRSARKTFMERLRVAPRDGGALTVMRTFWTREAERKAPSAFGGSSVPDAVAYADLLSTNAPRNAAVAAQIRSQILEARRGG